MKNQHNIFYRIGAAICRKILYRIEFSGDENIPESGALIICANHTSVHDPVIIDSIVKRKVQTMAKKEIFGNKLAGAIVRSVGAFPVDRTGGDVGAIKYTVKLLRAGGTLCIFPQGTRMPFVDPRTTTVRDGLGYFACKSHATVVPVMIQTKYMKVKMFKKTYVTFGKPITYEEMAFESECKNEYRRVSEMCFGKVCSMINEDLTDWDRLSFLKNTKTTTK